MIDLVGLRDRALLCVCVRVLHFDRQTRSRIRVVCETKDTRRRADVANRSRYIHSRRRRTLEAAGLGVRALDPLSPPSSFPRGLPFPPALGHRATQPDDGDVTDTRDRFPTVAVIVVVTVARRFVLDSHSSRKRGTRLPWFSVGLERPTRQRTISRESEERERRTFCDSRRCATVAAAAAIRAEGPCAKVERGALYPSRGNVRRRRARSDRWWR